LDAIGDLAESETCREIKQATINGETEPTAHGT
jgi:hypothetical protein